MKKGRYATARVVQCEVIRVDSPFFLINSQQMACRYETADGAVLARGYYLALWPNGGCLSFHGRELRYLGPFVTKAAACLLYTTALCLGIVDPGKAMNAVNEPGRSDDFAQKMSAIPGVGSSSSSISQHEKLVIQKHVKVAESLEALNAAPSSSIRDALFIQKLGTLEVLMNELFATEEEVLRLVGSHDSEMRKHIEEHDRLLSILLSIYDFSMKRKTMSVADVYELLKTELTQHVTQYDSVFSH